MTGIEPDEPSVRQIIPKRLGARGDEERVVLAPQDQRFGLMAPERRVPTVVQGDVGLVVLQQIELVGVGAGAIEQSLVDRPVIGADGFRVLGADQILQRLQRNKLALCAGCCVLGVGRSRWLPGMQR